MHAAGFAVAVVDPQRARLFAKACGHLAKTDRIDARMLARMGEALEPAATPPPSEALVELQELVNARTAATAERAALANRRDAAQTSFLRAELGRRLAAVTGHVERLDAAIDRRIRAESELARRYAILTSIPGIGPVTAAVLIANFIELGACSGKQAAMLAGVAPVACESGERIGHRAIKGGRRAVRNAVYMAALTASFSQSRPRNLCQAPAPEWQTSKGRSCRGHAKTHDPGQHSHRPEPPLEPNCPLTPDTDAHLVLIRHLAPAEVLQLAMASMPPNPPAPPQPPPAPRPGPDMVPIEKKGCELGAEVCLGADGTISTSLGCGIFEVALESDGDDSEAKIGVTVSGVSLTLGGN